MITKPSLIVVTWDGISTPLQYIYENSSIQQSQFDLLLFDYSGIDHSRDIDAIKCQYITAKTECKGQIISQVYQHFLTHSLAEKYTYIGIFDDDQYITVNDINKLLFIGALEQLDVFQPSLTHDSYFDNRQFIHKPGYFIKPTPWVEIMCPFYATDVFMEFAPHSNNNISGTGIDVYLVPTIQFLLGKNNTAVVHAVQIKHCRPIRTGKRIFSNNKTAVQEIQEMQAYSKSLLVNTSGINRNDTNYKRLMKLLNHSRNGDITMLDKIKRLPLLLKNLYRLLVDLSYR
jgi:hypothetical protein